MSAFNALVGATRQPGCLKGQSTHANLPSSCSRVAIVPSSLHSGVSSSGSSTALPLQPGPRCCTHQYTCTSNQDTNSHRGSRVIPEAAGRGGRGGSKTGRGSSSDVPSSSGWQDRLYSRDAPAADDGSGVGSSSRKQAQQQLQPAQTRGMSANKASRKGRPAEAEDNPSSSSSRGQRISSGSSAADGGSSEFVVIKKASPGTVGSYIPTTQELQTQQDTLDGSRYWDAALVDYDEVEDEFEEGEDEWEDGDEPHSGNEDEDVEVEEVVSLLRELAAGLEDEGSEEGEDGESGEGEDDGQDLGPAVTGAAGVQWRQAYLGSTQPPLTLGPVCVKAAAGKGRGLYTSAAVQAGEVMLACCPLTLLYSEEGTTPENEELAEHLAAAVAATAAAGGSSSSTGLAPWQQHALLQLRGPGEGGAASKLQQQQQQQPGLPDLRRLLGPPEEIVQMHDGSSSSSEGGGGQQQQQQQQQQQKQQAISAEQLTPLVFANCTGEEFEDPALALLRGATSCGHLGIWPAAALINHACAPNCHAMLLGDRLVVRAAREIPAGSELTLSYLGPQLFAPAAERQAELKQQWGFDCSCSRCKAEARYAGTASSSSSSSSSLAQELQRTYSRCQELSPQLDAAVDAEDLSAVRAVQRELLALQQTVENGMRAAKPPANVRRWLQASVYDLYDLLSLAADQLPPPPPKSSARGGRGGRGGRGRGRGSSSRDGPAVETEALATCARIVGELTPGSSSHVELATEYMVRTEARFGGGHQEADDASRLCATAITTRYAPISRSMLQLLMDTWAGQALL